MARVYIVGDSEVAKDLRAMIRVDPDLILSTRAGARFTVTVSESTYDVVSVETGPRISPSEQDVIAHIAMNVQRLLVDCGAGVADENAIIVSVPPGSSASLSARVAQGIYKGLLTAAKVEPLVEAPLAPAPAPVPVPLPLLPSARNRWYRFWRRWLLGLAALLLVTVPRQALAQASGQATIQARDLSTGVIVPNIGDTTNNAIRVNVVAGAAAGGTSSADGAAYVAGTTAGTPAMGAFDDAATAACAEDKVCLARLTAQRGLHVNLRTVAGAETGVAAVPLQVSLANTGTNATSVNVNCTGGCGGAATFADNSAFTFSTTTITNVGFVVDDTATNTVAENSAGAPRMTGSRVAYADLSLSASNTNSFKVDFGGAAQPVSGTVTVGTFPDNEPFNVAQMNGVAVTMGNGASGTGVQRVTLASDSTGQVTANAGTNLNTSLLALESGGNLATVAATVTASRVAVNPISGQAGVAAGSGTVGVTTQRVTLATDVALPTGANVIGQVTANAGTNLNTSLLALEAGGTLASLKTNTDPLVASGAGGYVRQDSTATIARESGGNLAAAVASLASIDADTTLIDNDLRGTSGTDTVLLALLREIRRQAPAFGPNAVKLSGSFGNAIGSTGDAINTVQKQPAPTFDPCLGPSKAPGTISQTANAVVLSAPGREVLVCHVFVVGAGAENLSLVYGTGTTCGTGTTAMIGGTTAAAGPNGAANGGWVVGHGAAWIARAPAGNDVCLLQSGATRVAGNFTYALR